jgi:two-component system invasion response regulator UvrY
VSVRVLVADDQAPFRLAARSVVGATSDFELVGEARSGREAIELTRSLRPDLVLMDIAMPDLDGIEAARSIAATFPATVTILLSTYRAEDVPERARTCGAAAYVHKSDFCGPVLRVVWDGRAYTSSAR